MKKRQPFSKTTEALAEAGAQLVGELTPKLAMRLRWYLSNLSRRELDALGMAMLGEMERRLDWEGLAREHAAKRQDGEN